MSRENLGNGKCRIYSLELLRVIATLAIILPHYQQITGMNMSKYFDCTVSSFNVAYVVEFFFILSGFLTYKEVCRLKRSEITAKDFLIKKFNRLIPVIVLPSIFYTVLCYFFRTFVGNGGWYFDTKVDIPSTILAAFGVQFWGLFEGTPINYPLWYVDVLLMCYIIMCFIVWLFKKLDYSEELGFIIMIFIGIVIWNREIDLPFLSMHLARGYYSFFFGIILAYWYEKGKSQNLDKHKTMLVLLLIGIISMAVTIHWIDWFKPYDNYVYTFLSYPAFILFFLNSRIQRVLNIPALGALGKVSYDIYAWHLDVYFLFTLLCVTGVIPWNMDSNIMMIINVSVAVVIGAVSYLFVDKRVANVLVKIKRMFI